MLPGCVCLYCSMPGLPVPHYLPEFAQVHVHCIGDITQLSGLWRPLLLLLSVFPSIRDFSSELAVHVRWPEHWSFSISPSNEYSGLIFFKINWFDVFAVQGTLRCLLQQDSSKTSILWHSAFFTVQLSPLYLTTGKTRALTVGSVMSLFFSTLSRFVIAFLPRSSHLLISWLQSPSRNELSSH